MHCFQEIKSLKKEFIMFVFQQFVLIQYWGQKGYLQVYLEQWKYKIKKKELLSFIDDEVNLSLDNDSDNLDE